MGTLEFGALRAAAALWVGNGKQLIYSLILFTPMHASNSAGNLRLRPLSVVVAGLVVFLLAFFSFQMYSQRTPCAQMIQSAVSQRESNLYAELHAKDAEVKGLSERIATGKLEYVAMQRTHEETIAQLSAQVAALKSNSGAGGGSATAANGAGGVAGNKPQPQPQQQPQSAADAGGQASASSALLLSAGSSSSSSTLPPVTKVSAAPAEQIALLLFTYSRADNLAKTLNSIFERRPTLAESLSGQRWHLFVSQQDDIPEVSRVLETYVPASPEQQPANTANGRNDGRRITRIRYRWEEPANLGLRDRRWLSYYKIAHHFKFGLSHVLDTMGYGKVIILEDDMNLAPDFFEYFEATAPLLDKDPSLYCVSAWNDNGHRVGEK